MKPRTTTQTTGTIIRAFFLGSYVKMRYEIVGEIPASPVCSQLSAVVLIFNSSAWA